MRQLDYNWEFNVLNIENYRLQNKLTRYFDFIIENHDRLDGDIFEFGVYKGHSLLALAMLLKKLGNDELDWVMLLQPTAPIRRTEHIFEAIQLAQACQCDSVIGLRRVFAEHPILMKKIENGRVVSYCVEEREGTRWQEYDPLAYMRNSAIYLTKRDVVIHDNSLWGKFIYLLVMDEESSVNIDSILDFEMAELLMKEYQA